MRYICYLSRDRVDSLFESAFDGLVDGVKRTTTGEGSASLEVGLSQMLMWIKSGLTFGGKLSREVETQRRITAVSRLDHVIAYVEREGTAAPLVQAIASKRISADWHEINTELHVPAWDPESDVVDMKGDVAGYELVLSCNKAHFSGLYSEGGRLIPTSTNRFLFEGNVALPMNGLVKVIDVDVGAQRIFGAPLYLVLNPFQIDLGEFNDVEV